MICICLDYSHLDIIIRIFSLNNRQYQYSSSSKNTFCKEKKDPVFEPLEDNLENAVYYLGVAVHAFDIDIGKFF